jgi:hypothetical protein
VLARRGLAVLSVAALVTAGAVAVPSAQAVAMHVVRDELHVRAPGFRFLTGTALDRLKDGRAVPFDFELGLRPRPGAAADHVVRRRFVLSYDLWEERFAATLMGTPSRSISHLTAADAEAWCLDQLTVPLGVLAANQPFWVHLQYVAEERDREPRDSGGFTLGGLIERLSQRRQPGAPGNEIEAGPFRLPN